MISTVYFFVLIYIPVKRLLCNLGQPLDYYVEIVAGSQN